MTTHLKIELTCNFPECGAYVEWYEPNWTQLNEKARREESAGFGWQQMGQEDFCPEHRCPGCEGQLPRHTCGKPIVGDRRRRTDGVVPVVKKMVEIRPDREATK